MTASVKVDHEFNVSVERLWAEIGSFTKLDWTGDDPWEFDGNTRSLPAHGMKEELVSTGERSYTYRMLEGPFNNFSVTISATGGAERSVAHYSAAGDLSAEEQGMVKEGTMEAFKALASRVSAQA